MANLFLVHYGVELGLKALAISNPGIAWLVTGVPGDIISFFASRFLSFMTEKGILVLDLGKVAIDVGLEDSHYVDAIKKAYAKATLRVYTEGEKIAIRKQYLDAMRPFASVGDGVRS